MNKYSLEQLVLKRINVMRNEMIQIAHETGMNSAETINYSQKLDRLIYLHLLHFSISEPAIHTGHSAS
ncbi:aspartyl-phosphate phosphatase Spo0E family protein [Bacillus sp. DTU_2020_1000418_1_SI_GHA_SEK_038]|uniref:aspartyl-phosphate phosphatase Spo0E family protein n=1 Tax=Bacillus sp. DTU_2020_1000418_1_SI_GHA_SEK_038 TaxID=3077585 RepID=UPI0028ED5E4B|nr:aspartyl-phosphate phosphatase Spo0E family protein [Bacillus sp. DTU_2020_1000418_1_SI_GHA_SEK_038]WNS74756.1 aspartyl-phosphate phosphatase Spo0E family protein [Bacillus sp. DTU_2020_1000418_1_SI_GHA_SEK_038]